MMHAVIKSITSGDTLVLAHPTKIPPVEKTFTLAHIQTPRLARRNETTEEAFAFAAREFVRRKCLGKPITFQVEYKNKTTGRDFGNVFVQLSKGRTENLAVALLREGLATLKGKNFGDDDEYSIATAQAQSAGVNLWTQDEEEKKKNTRVAQWDKFNAEKLIKSFNKKPVSVIVEHVLNGSVFRVQLPEHQMIVLNLTGVTSPSIRYNENKESGEKEQIAQPYAKEAVQFVESKYLQRDVYVLFEGVDKYGNVMGTILRSKNPKDSDTGSITLQEDLLSRGLAKVADWSIGLSKYVTRFKRAEDQAKRQNINLWKDYEAPESSLTSDDKGVMKARIIEVLSGDTMRVRNLKTLEDEKISLSSIRVPKFGPKGANPEPWAIESREYIRSKTAGKVLHVSVDYRRVMGKSKDKEGEEGDDKKKNANGNEEERRFCTVLVDNKLNLTKALVESGLATVVRHGKNDERSPHYFQFLQAEKEAISRHLCVHGKKSPPVHRSNDLTNQTSGQVQKYLMLLKDKTVKGIVEKVFSGTRFKLYLPTEYFMINFSLSGIMSPSLGPRNEPEKVKPFSREALIFSQNKIAMCEVDVHIESLDKTGSFVGNIFIGRENVGIDLLREGLALTTPFAKRLKNWAELEGAEGEARVAKKNIWSLDDISVVRRERKREEVHEDKREEEDEPSVSENEPTMAVRVTEVVDGTRFFYQTPESIKHLEQLDEVMKQLQLDGSMSSTYVPKEGDICFSKFGDGEWYRGRIISVDSKNKVAHVFYVDFGNSEREEPFSALQPIHNSATSKSIPFQAKEANLAFVRLHPEKYHDHARAALFDLAEGRDLTARVVYKIGRQPYVTLVDPSDNTDIGSVLVRSGLAFVSKPRKIARNASLVSQLENMEHDLDYAKSQRVNLWEFGDIYEDEEENSFYAQ